MLDWFWLAEFAFTLAAYVVLDGFDLGVGILSGIAGSAPAREEMLASISPVWDGNGTWLVIAGTILWGAFPPVYSIVLPALYIPLAAMLFGLIMRGVSIEFSHKAKRSRWVWDALLCVGSIVAAFMQGVAVGSYAQGLPVSALRYVGNGFEWCGAFPLSCGMAVVLGYAVLGAGWLVLKGEGRLQQFGRTAVSRLVPFASLFIASIFVTTLVTHREIEARWLAHPVLFLLPLLSLLAFAGSSSAARAGSARHPYVLAAAGCVLLLLTLAVSLLPYVVPFDLTISEAAAPASTQKFMFWGAGLFVLPLIVAYTYIAYSVFRGKVSHEHGYH
ncbi:cytochrome d ubiquinol oxidase subunit II [Paraburkholderia sp. EG287A]|uniref:cytochrome d ubiquinol oxidase subunit II n=1 Tax=Paraburkholderia sp. EG287A TaxID=3237012 RepID=UPI0034D2E420